MARRWKDEIGESHPDRRRASSSEHAKWAIGVVTTAVVALAGWGLLNDRKNVESRLESLDARVTATEQLTRTIVAAQSRQDAQADARWEEVKRSLERIERDVSVVKARQ